MCRHTTKLTAGKTVFFADCAKPFKDRKGENGSADRRVAAQPVMHEEEANLRKLNSLPWHLMQLHDSSRLNEECLFNIEFLTVKMKYTSVRYEVSNILLPVYYFPFQRADPNKQKCPVTPLRPEYVERLSFSIPQFVF